VQVLGQHDADDRVAARRRVVVEEHERLAVRRHLDRTEDDALARQLVGPRAFEGPAGDPEPDAVGVPQHGVRAFEPGREPVGARTFVVPQHYDRRTAGHCGSVPRHIERGADGKPLSVPDHRRPHEREGVGAAGAEDRLDRDATGHGDVGPDAVRGGSYLDSSACRDRQRLAPGSRATADENATSRTGDGQAHGSGHIERDAADRRLQQGAIGRVADKAVGEGGGGRVKRTRGRYAEMGVAETPEVLDRGQRTTVDDLEVTR
jgi:hypothetical protein